MGINFVSARSHKSQVIPREDSPWPQFALELSITKPSKTFLPALIIQCPRDGRLSRITSERTEKEIRVKFRQGGEVFALRFQAGGMKC